MLATASRGINGRLRQKPFGVGAVLLKKDRAPFKKLEKIGKFDSKNTEPVLLAPLGKVPSSFKQSNKDLKNVDMAFRPASKIRIKKNHYIEMKMMRDDLRPMRIAIAALATRPGGPYGKLEKAGSATSTQALCEGDFVVLSSEMVPYSVVVRSANPSMSVTLDGTLTLFKPDDILVRFANFVDEKLAKDACPAIVISSLDADEEPFDLLKYNARARICKQLDVLQRQVESNLQKLLPAFEEVYLSNKDQTSIQEGIIRTPDVAKRLIEHPLYPLSRAALTEAGKREEHDGEEEEDDEEGGYDAETMNGDVNHEDMTLHEHSLEADSLPSRSIEKQTADSPAILLATHQLLHRNSHLFGVDSLRHNQTQTFAVRPLAERTAVTQVKTWIDSALENVSKGVKDSSNPIRSFAQKAKKIMKLRQEQSLAASAERPGEPRTIKMDASSATNWTTTDLTIIQALRASSGHQYRLGVRDHLTALVYYIVKECGLGQKMEVTPLGRESGKFDRSTNQMSQQMSVDLLMRLGFLAPWENVPNMDMEFRHMIQDFDATSEEEEAKLASRVDPDESIRVDFDLPVYVIDDPSAFELDDGISIEATSREKQYWIHVTIADPTTAIDINDPIARQAERRHSSIYAIDAHRSMLPDSITRKYGLRVADKEKDKSYANGMQFSTLIDVTNGKVEQSDVRLVRIKDVRVITYDQADILLKTSDESQVIGRDLKMLHRAAILLEERRRSVGGALSAPGYNSSISLDPLPLPPSPVWQVTDNYAPVAPIFAGFPHIHHHLNGVAESGMGPKFTFSHGLVAELMILANRIASKWISERSMPALFGGQAAPAKKEDRQKLYNLRDEDGVIAYQKLLQSGVLFSPGATSTRPMEHFSLGLKTAMAMQSKNKDVLTTTGYARVTSPLRRYQDLLNHWQIKHTLRSGGGKRASPLISQEELLDLIPRQDRMNAWCKLTEKNAGRYYFALKLQRGLQSRIGQIHISPQEKQEVDTILDATHEALVSIAEVRIRSAYYARIRVQLIGLGASAEMKWNPLDVDSPPLGTKVQVKITDVVVTGSTGNITVERI